MPHPINRTMTPGEWGLLVLLALIWGGSYFYNGVAIKAVPPLSIVAFRVAGGALLLYAVVRATGGRMPRDRATWTGFLTMGILNSVVPFSLIAWAQSHVASGLAAVLNATTPLFGVIIANALTADEKMTPNRVVGVIVGFVGVVIMIGPDALAGAMANVEAELALLLASVFYAFSGVYGRRFGRAGLSPMVAAAGQFSAAAAVMVPLALLIDHPWTLPAPSAGVWGALFGLAAVSTCLAYILYYRILATAGAVNLMLVTFLVPVSAIILGIVFLHEPLANNEILGMVGIGFGLAAIDGRPLRILRRQIA